METLNFVIPAKAGSQRRAKPIQLRDVAYPNTVTWTPACAGVTILETNA